MLFSTSVAEVDGCVHLSVVGEIDLSTAPRLRADVIRSANRSTRLVLDLSGVDFIDSVGMGVLVGAHRRVAAGGGGLTVFCPDRRLEERFTQYGLDRILDLRSKPTAGPR